jgi:light-harvesting protein B-800-850 alpha chain
MNQGRIWTVVNPTVGLPLFLGSVAVTSLIVHASVLTHTTWMSAYWQGGSKAKTAAEGAAPEVAALASRDGSPVSVTVTPIAGANATAPASFVITVAPNSAAGNVEHAASNAAGRAAPMRSASAK